MSYNLTGSSASSTYGRLGTSTFMEHLTYTMMASGNLLSLGVGTSSSVGPQGFQGNQGPTWFSRKFSYI
jgi:hypothetical protein